VTPWRPTLCTRETRGFRVQVVLGCRVCGTEAGSYLRLIDSCITQLKAQGPSGTCDESKEEEEAGFQGQGSGPREYRDALAADVVHPRDARGQHMLLTEPNQPG